MAENIDIPKVGKLPKTTVYVIGGLGAAYVAYRYYKNYQDNKAAAAAPSPDNTSLTGTDTNFGVDTGAGAGGYNYPGNFNSSTSSVDQTQTPTTNAQWTQNAVAYAAELGWDTGTVATAVGLYLRGSALTSSQQNIISAVLAGVGSPPVGGPYPIITNTSPSPSSLPAPTGLKAVANADNSVTITFNPVSGAHGYSAVESGLGDAIVGYSGGAPALKVPGLQPNKSYTFQVAARNSANTRGALSAKVTVKTTAVKLAAPTGLRASHVTRTGVTLTANPVKGADHYLWYVNGAQHQASDAPSVIIAGLRPNTTYSLSVRGDTVTQTPGPLSAAIRVKTPK